MCVILDSLQKMTRNFKPQKLILKLLLYREDFRAGIASSNMFFFIYDFIFDILRPLQVSRSPSSRLVDWLPSMGDSKNKSTLAEKPVDLNAPHPI